MRYERYIPFASASFAMLLMLSRVDARDVRRNAARDSASGESTPTLRSLDQTGQADSVLARWLYDPNGRPAGAWLADGTLVPASPAQAVLLTACMRPGDRVSLRYGLANTLTVVDTDARTQVDLGPLTLARGGGPNSASGPAPRDPVWSGLVQRTDTAPLRAIGRDLGGRPRVLLLDDGLQVHLPPRVEEVAGTLAIGAPLVVQGYAAPGDVRAAWASRIASPDGRVVLDLARRSLPEKP